MKCNSQNCPTFSMRFSHRLSHGRRRNVHMGRGQVWTVCIRCIEKIEASLIFISISNFLPFENNTIQLERLGHGVERNSLTPRLVESLVGKRPKELSCGGFHTAVVTEDGRLYTFGGGEHGQLGHNDRVNKVKPTFVQALDGVFVSQITCGWSHSVALTSEGKIYTWGNGGTCDFE